MRAFFFVYLCGEILTFDRRYTGSNLGANHVRSHSAEVWPDGLRRAELH